MQTAALQALRALLTAGAPLLGAAQRRQLDDVAAHVAATAAAAVAQLSGDAEAAVGAGMAGLQLAAYQLLLASVLAPAPHRPPHLAAALRLFRGGSSGGALGGFCRQVRAAVWLDCSLDVPCLLLVRISSPLGIQAQPALHAAPSPFRRRRCSAVRPCCTRARCRRPRLLWGAQRRRRQKTAARKHSRWACRGSGAAWARRCCCSRSRRWRRGAQQSARLRALWMQQGLMRRWQMQRCLCHFSIWRPRQR